MTTWCGEDYYLIFTCGQCGNNEKILVDLAENKDKEALWEWLQTHSAEGGKYETVKVEVKKDRVEELFDRMKERHE